MNIKTGKHVIAKFSDLFTTHRTDLLLKNDDIDFHKVEKSELSLGSRSFLHTNIDRVQKLERQSSKNSTQTVRNVLG